jgi:predicted PurR-regulated permease PerM
MVSPAKALWFILFIIVLQQFEGNVIYPRVMGNSVGLPAMWVLFAVTVGGSTFGIVGMLLAVPVTSIVYTLLKEAVSCRLEEKGIAGEKLK